MTDVDAMDMMADEVDGPIAPGFGDGDLGRVQALLFGDHARITSDRIDRLEQALLGAISDLRSDVDTRLGELRNDMDARMDELDRRIEAESENRTKAVANVGSRLAEDVKVLTKADRTLERNLVKTTEKLTTAIDRSSTASKDALELTRQNLTTAIDRSSTASKDALELTRQSLSEQIEQANTALRESNVDRGALAGMMAAVAEQLAQEKS